MASTRWLCPKLSNFISKNIITNSASGSEDSTVKRSNRNRLLLYFLPFSRVSRFPLLFLFGKERKHLPFDSPFVCRSEEYRSSSLTVFVFWSMFYFFFWPNDFCLFVCPFLVIFFCRFLHGHIAIVSVNYLQRFHFFPCPFLTPYVSQFIRIHITC